MIGLSEVGQNVIATQPCKKCGGIMNIKIAWTRKGIAPLLPCVAQCGQCKSWFDCRYPKVG